MIFKTRVRQVSSLDKNVEALIERYKLAETPMERAGIRGMYEHMINVNVLDYPTRQGYVNYFEDMTRDSTEAKQ